MAHLLSEAATAGGEELLPSTHAEIDDRAGCGANELSAKLIVPVCVHRNIVHDEHAAAEVSVQFAADHRARDAAHIRRDERAELIGGPVADLADERYGAASTIERDDAARICWVIGEDHQITARLVARPPCFCEVAGLEDVPALSRQSIPGFRIGSVESHHSPTLEHSDRAAATELRLDIHRLTIRHSILSFGMRIIPKGNIR
ncbi:hypothetical protein [Brevibacterium casei]|uniref:hypothetical protein n=1 Tax=Brevibacterium casei TaxID=33889 RepID=UPI00223BB1EA|nr:hypothetical protein [Brevibacterium casei]MCT1550174.1 hypothetical protein [Brevibacterium casei]MCT1560118.1 hypothetical protein [Brevibacterium casei]MCT2208272.1 hypothetical protein [Brevibacterium casei]